MAAGNPFVPASPQVEDPLSAYSRLTQLRSLAQQQQLQGLEIQKQQLMLQDQKELSRAWADSNGDIQKYTSNVLDPAYGISPAGRQQSLTSIFQLRSEATKLKGEEFDFAHKTATALNEAYDEISNLPAEKRPAAYTRKLAELQDEGVDVSHLPQEYSEQSFQQFGVPLKTTMEALNERSKQADIYKSTNEGDLAAVKTPGATAESTIQQQQAALTPGQRALQGNLYYQAAQGTPGAQQAVNLETQQKIGVAGAEEKMRFNLQRQLYSGSALEGVPPHLVSAASNAADKAGQDYAQALSVAQRMKDTMDAARRGNVISYQIIPEEGTLQITTSQGVHRINQAEISQYAGGGSLWQRMVGHFGRATSGQSIPAGVLDDMSDIQNIQINGAYSKYNNALNVVNKTYGSSFSPVQMEGPSSLPGTGGSTSTATSQTHVFSVSAWQKANPSGDANAAKALAQQRGYEVVP